MKDKLKFDIIKESIGKLFDTGFFHIFGSNVINKILAFLSSVLIVRFVTKADYGVYTASLNRLSFFLLLSGLGMISAVLQLCSENANDKDTSYDIYTYGSKIGILFNLILAAFIILGSLIIPNSIEGSNKMLLYMAFIPFFEIINEFQKVYFRSSLDNKSYSYANTASSIFVVAFSIAGVLCYDVYGLIIGRYIAAIVSIVVTRVILKGPIAINRKVKSVIDKATIFKIAIVSMLNGGISELLYLFDILIIGEVMGASEAIADYKISIIIPSALLFIPASICVYVYPYFSLNKDNKTWLKDKYRILMMSLGGLNLCASLAMIVMAPFIIKTLFGAQYLGAVTMFRVAATNYFFAGTFRIIAGNLLVTQRKLAFNFYVSLISGLLNVASNYILVIKLGAIGAAWTTLFITMATGIVSTVYFIKTINKI